MKIELEIRPAPGGGVLEPWSANDRLHHQQQARLHKAWKEGTHHVLRRWLRMTAETSNESPRPFGVVQVTIPFPQRRIRDPHNYCGTIVKAVIDGLKDQTAPNPRKGGPRIVTSKGLWPDDSPEYVGHREPLLVIADENPTVTITFEGTSQ